MNHHSSSKRKNKKKSHSISSNKWLSRHFSDPYVEQAKKLGYHSRAVFKLEEIQQRTNLIEPHSLIVDLGAAPGAFSQFALEKAPRGRVIACDLLPIKAIEKITFIRGDFTEQETYQAILAALNGKRIDVLLSDISPNLSGNDTVDSAKSMALAELAYQFAYDFLNDRGALVIKLFQGSGFSELIHKAKHDFIEVKTIKPKASRKESKEIYLFAREKKVIL